MADIEKIKAMIANKKTRLLSIKKMFLVGRELITGSSKLFFMIFFHF